VLPSCATRPRPYAPRRRPYRSPARPPTRPAGTVAALIPHLAPDTPLILADGSVPAPAGVEGFGRCLLRAVQALFDRGHAAACVLSADSRRSGLPSWSQRPHFSLPATIGAWSSGACDDGGYYPLGLRRPHAGLFADIAWSTDTVAAQTRDRAPALGLGPVEIASLVRHRQRRVARPAGAGHFR